MIFWPAQSWASLPLVRDFLLGFGVHIHADLQRPPQMHVVFPVLAGGEKQGQSAHQRRARVAAHAAVGHAVRHVRRSHFGDRQAGDLPGPVRVFLDWREQATSFE